MNFSGLQKVRRQSMTSSLVAVNPECLLSSVPDQTTAVCRLYHPGVERKKERKSMKESLNQALLKEQTGCQKLFVCQMALFSTSQSRFFFFLFLILNNASSSLLIILPLTFFLSLPFCHFWGTISTMIHFLVRPFLFFLTFKVKTIFFSKITQPKKNKIWFWREILLPIGVKSWESH